MENIILALIGIVFLWGSMVFGLIIYLITSREMRRNKNAYKAMKSGKAFEIFPDDMEMGLTKEENKDWVG
jgi:hypothetical protein